MKTLYTLSKKKTKKIIGLMSGTSLDGVDAVLVKVRGNGTDTKFKQLGYITYPFPAGLKEMLLENSRPGGGNVSDICRLNFVLPHVYADAAKALCAKTKTSLDEVDLIGSHGQTIHHLPQKELLFGYKTGSTLQIGCPSVISKLTGVITVGDFRNGDAALGGEGAPLVPYFDYLLFHSKKVNRALLNIGGISNFTILNKNESGSNVLAFDTGPGNMMIDLLAERFFDEEYDKNGRHALSGKVNEELFNAFTQQDTYIEKMPPKSTGREYYGMEFLIPLLNQFTGVSGNDWLATASSFTASAIYRSYIKFVHEETAIAELYVSGGGAKNKFIVKELSRLFGKNVKISNIKKLGISADSKEAVCFAVLANETLTGNPSNIPRVTGASRETILGKICLP